MRTRLLLITMLLGAFFRCHTAWSDLGQLEQLPSVDMSSAPVVPMADFIDESSWLDRWRQSHEDRADADTTSIVTDRPSFTYSSSTVPQGWAQVEMGYLYASKNGSPSNSIHTLPELALRYGLTNRLELRAIWTGVSLLGDGQFARFDYSDSRTYNVQVGIKYQVSQNHGWVPQSAIVSTLFLPTGDGWTMPVPSNLPNRSGHVSPLVDYVYTWQLTEGWSLGGSTGGIFDGDNGFSVTEYFQSVIFRFQWNPRLSLFFEGYSFFGSQEINLNYGWPYYYNYSYERSYTAPYLDAGVLWRPSRNVQFDWRAGLGFGDDAENFFTGCGLSFRY
jgi:hypothetical protein